MAAAERVLWITAIAIVATVLLARRGPAPHEGVERPRARPGVRLSMQALHQQGGVPLGWQMTLPPGNAAAGRARFVDFGCHACHRVAGESFARDAGDLPGPDLTGMGSHHPAAYFAEAILNPDAVLIDAPGYVDADGHSIMPSYPDMTTGELSDLVAYLGSLTSTDAPASCHANAPPAAAAVTIASVDLRDRPPPGAPAAGRFFTQSYDVLPDQLAALERWFASDGRRRFREVEGLVGLDTFVDLTRPAAVVTTQLAFRDETALRNFLADPAAADLWKQFDAFIGPHGHHASDRPLVYRAPSLSAQ